MTKKILSLAALAAIMACKSSQTTEAPITPKTPEAPAVVEASAKEELIPSDPSVVQGTLSNGMKYYLKNNGKPADKVELRLVVNAGSILEDDDQQGLAHFMEHMNFNGTKNFKKNELVDYLQGIGVKFGAHLNAYTGFDETVYILPIPSDDPEKLEKGFQIIEDWAFNALLTDEEINKERGVVLEELRTRLDAENRMMQNYLPKVLYKSKYSKRLPIGKKEILENFHPDAIRRFHKDWYRPELMSVIAVGDVDIATLEAKVKSHFGSYPASKNPRKREVFSTQNHDETFIAIEADKEATFNQIQLMYKAVGTAKPEVTLADARHSLVDGLFSQMINNRLGELRNSANPPFVYGYSFYGGTWVRNKEAYQSIAMATEGKQLEALKALVEENERVKRFGFQKGELARAKTAMMAQLDKMYENRDKQESKRLIQPYIDNFLEGEAMPSVEWAVNFSKKEIPTITLEDVNGLIEGYLSDKNRVVIIKGKEKTVTKQQVTDLLNSVKTDTSIKAYQDETVQESLFTALPTKGSITKETKNEKLGITTLTLSNGATVKYKKTDFKNDEIVFQAQSYGGTSLISDKDYLAANLALRGVTEAGIAGLNKNDLKKFLTGKIANVRPYVSSLSEKMTGSSTPKDLETLFQLIHLNFTAINKDQEAFNSYTTKQKGFMGNLLANPQYFFMNEMSKFRYGKSPRFTGFPTVEDYDKTNYELAYKIFKERFANAGDFSFYFVGNIDEAKLKEYSELYLASLPANNSREEYKDLGFRPLSGKHEKLVNKGNDPKSQVSIIYTGETKYDAYEALYFKALSEILGIKMTEKLREEAAGVYSPRVRGSITESAYDSFNLTISFGCGPENVNSLKAIANQEVANIIANGPTEKDLNKAKEAFLLARKEGLEKNKFWLQKIADSDFDKKDINKIFEYNDAVNKLTTKDIQNVAKKYLSKGAITGILMPENTK
ncbi:M16 family metallopeptidase [Pseudofulvibacter geojedonensis]|uniref:M16 family metallopeptidase n=1 Tax=Pseudofulvibacter geojedonensis TaxID=1123758 RepID=A0ABW3I2F0_9FLAO